jgi:hypothetical protein
MINNRNKIAVLAAAAACASLAIWIDATHANPSEQSVLVLNPADNAKRAETAKQPDAKPAQTKPPVNTDAAPVLPPPNRPTAKAPTPNATMPPQKSDSARTSAKRPFMRPAVPRDVESRERLAAYADPQALPPPADARPDSSEHSLRATPDLRENEPQVKVHPAPPIKYDTDHDARKMYRSGQVQLVMVTQDPADGCCYEIPMCIPACCTGEPKISSGRGLLGRGVVEYCWQCGFRAKVKFRHTLGDVRVDYEGD